MMKRLLFGLFACLLWSQSAWAVLSVSNSGAVSGSSISVVGNANDVIVIYIYTVSGGGSSDVTSLALLTGEVFTKRTAITPYNAGGLFITLEEWYFVATAPVSGVTNVIFSNTPAFVSISFISIGGANTATPFDTNGSLPALASSMPISVAPSLSISTTNANTILLGALVLSNASSADPGTGYTDFGYVSVTLSGNSDGEYKIVSSTQSSTAVGWGASSTNPGIPMGMIADAVQAAGGGATASPKRTLMGIGQ